jgi:hypothetical protein
MPRPDNVYASVVRLSALLGSGAGLAAATVIACGALTQPQASPAPLNVCDAGCAAFDAECAQVGVTTTSACQTPVAPFFVLIVTVPALATVEAGTTYALTSQQVLGTTPPFQCIPPPPAGEPCVVLPAVDFSAGGYFVNQLLQNSARRNVGLGAAGPSPFVTLPVTVTFWPEWSGPAGPKDARLYNLPLPPIVASVGVAELTQAGIALPGTGAPRVGWYAGLPPLPADSTAIGSPYNAVVAVDPPFNDGYPDQTYIVPGDSTPGIPVGTTAELPLGIGPTTLPAGFQPTPITVKRAAGLDGWTVFIRENATSIIPPAIVSSRPHLAGSTSTVQMNLIGLPTSASSLVIEPPFGSLLPEFADPIIGSLSMLPMEVYPPLPPAATLAGDVLSDDGTPVSATILFTSSEIDTLGSSAACVPTTPAGLLSYQAQVYTDDQLSLAGKQGHFTVQLPQGTYNYVIEPTPASGYAKASVVHNVQVGDCMASGSGSPGPLRVSPLLTVSGSFATPDGRPLANASVDFTPSALLVVPTAPSKASFTPLSQWPRPFTVTTGAAGGFSIDVDLGVYDITARPQDGTNFAWVVAPGHAISQSEALPRFTVAAPFVVDLALHQQETSSSDIPLPNAIVQAFEFTSCSSASPSYCQPVAVPVGEAMTDAQGHFTMMLSTFVD